MKNFSVPPYDLGTIGDGVKRLGELTGVECELCAHPALKSQGYYSLPTLSEDISNIAAQYGLTMNITGDLEETGKQLQSLIDALILRGVFSRADF
jgi:hypothetical protein